MKIENKPLVFSLLLMLWFVLSMLASAKFDVNFFLAALIIGWLWYVAALVVYFCKALEMSHAIREKWRGSHE